jgi:signal transduction histidine kinase
MSDGYAPMRSWSRSVAGKLQIAFGLIAALTVVATAVALYQFIRADDAMQGLSSRSIPAVKLSLSLETSAAEVAAATALLARSNYEFQRVERAADMRERMARMNDRLARLGTLLGPTPEFERLAGLVRAVETNADVLDNAMREKVKIGFRREQTTELVGPTVDAIGRLLAPISDRIVFDTSLALEDESSIHNGDLKAIADRDLPRLQSVYDMRAYIHVVGSLLAQVSTEEYIEEIPPLQDQFTAAQERLDRISLALITNSSGVDAAAVADLRTEMQRLFDLGQGADGLFSLRTRELQSTADARARQNEVQSTADEMGLALNALVTTTEREATQTTALTSSQISTARTWLIILAIASLAIAGLIMWLFVHRYIVARLKALSSSMLSVAGGNLDAPVPEPRPDEIGDMSRALSVFRDNAREIRSAKEEAERARAAAEEASRTKSAFLANMSHELRTPLNAIIGYSEMLLEDAADRGDDASDTDLRKIQPAVKLLLGLINDILDL